MCLSLVSVKAVETLSDTIDGFFKPIVNDYLIPIIFWDPIRFLGFDLGRIFQLLLFG